MIMPQSEDVQTKVLNPLWWDLAVPPHKVKVTTHPGASVSRVAQQLVDNDISALFLSSTTPVALVEGAPGVTEVRDEMIPAYQ